jgi:hypothetical protein
MPKRHTSADDDLEPPKPKKRRKTKGNTPTLHQRMWSAHHEDKLPVIDDPVYQELFGVQGGMAEIRGNIHRTGSAVTHYPTDIYATDWLPVTGESVEGFEKALWSVKVWSGMRRQEILDLVESDCGSDRKLFSWENRRMKKMFALYRQHNPRLTKKKKDFEEDGSVQNPDFV